MSMFYGEVFGARCDPRLQQPLEAFERLERDPRLAGSQEQRREPQVRSTWFVFFGETVDQGQRVFVGL